MTHYCSNIVPMSPTLHKKNVRTSMHPTTVADFEIMNMINSKDFQEATIIKYPDPKISPY